MDAILDKHKKIGFDRIYNGLNKIICLFLLSILPTNLLILSVEAGTSFQEIPGQLYPIFIAYFLIGFIYNIIRISMGLKTPNIHLKKQLSYFLIAIVSGLFCALTAFLSIHLFSFSAYLIFYSFEVLYTLITAIAVTKHELMDVKLVIKKYK